MRNAISDSVITLANSIDAKAIIAETKTGATALQISARRPAIALVVVTSETRTAQQLAIAYDVKSYVRPDDPQAAIKLSEWLRKTKLLTGGDIVIMVSGRQPGATGMTDTIKVRALE
jgi:pyruvate kinase